jgi:transcriptional regulator with XRE-family HTH domain
MKNQPKELLKNLTSDELSLITSRISYLRQTILKMTQQQFADTIKVSQAYLSLIECGKKNLNSEILLQIAYTLKINLDWLIYGIGDDSNIFQNEDQTAEVITQNLKQEALDNLKSAYSLKDSDAELIQRYLSLNDQERNHIQKALSSLHKLC